MRVENWGLISYAEALDRQLKAVDEVVENGDERLIFCSHPAVVTLGRATQPGDVFSFEGDVLEIQRGGRATYHGPSQIVVYPILRLESRGRDISKYLRALEGALIAVLNDFGVDARAEKDATGVWVGTKKIASIGIGVKRWVVYHGIALNLDYDPTAFHGLNPCGFQSSVMTCLENVLGHTVAREDVERRLEMELFLALSDRSEGFVANTALELDHGVTNPIFNM